MNKQDKLWDKQGKLIEDIRFTLETFEEETVSFIDVTEEYPTTNDFIGQSVIETYGGNLGYSMCGEDGETIFAQSFSGKKQIWTHLSNGGIKKIQFLVVDPSTETPIKKIDYVAKKINELREAQQELEVLESAEKVSDEDE